jgi:hypothetical protein
LLAKPYASLNQRLQIGWQGASILNAHFQVAQAFGCAESEQTPSQFAYSNVSFRWPVRLPCVAGATPTKHDFTF